MMHAPQHTHDMSRGRVYNTVDATNWMWSIGQPTVVASTLIMHAAPMASGVYEPMAMTFDVFQRAYTHRYGPVPIKVKKGACTVTIYTPGVAGPGMHNASTVNVQELPVIILVLDVWNSAGERPTKIFASIAQTPGHENVMHYAMDAITTWPFVPEILQLSSSSDANMPM